VLPIYGARKRGALTAIFLRAFLPIALAYTRLRYRQIARSVARQLQDYVRSGFTVAGIVGIDGSPSCGVNRSIHIRSFVQSMGDVDATAFTVPEPNDLVRGNVLPGRGIFVEELARELAARGLNVPFLAHDLLGELEGRASM
jgi:hypothetical protein